MTIPTDEMLATAKRLQTSCHDLLEVITLIRALPYKASPVSGYAESLKVYSKSIKDLNKKLRKQLVKYIEQNEADESRE